MGRVVYYIWGWFDDPARGQEVYERFLTFHSRLKADATIDELQDYFGSENTAETIRAITQIRTFEKAVGTFCGAEPQAGWRIQRGTEGLQPGALSLQNDGARLFDRAHEAQAGEVGRALATLLARLGARDVNSATMD